MRRYDDPIEVRHRGVAADPSDAPGSDPGSDPDSDPDSDPGPPESFVWRGRRYRVRATIGHWHERTPWWRHALGSPGGALVLQEEIWRVEAALVRSSQNAHVGVFDLARGCRWRLVRMAD